MMSDEDELDEDEDEEDDSSELEAFEMPRGRKPQVTIEEIHDEEPPKVRAP